MLANIELKVTERKGNILKSSAMFALNLRLQNQMECATTSTSQQARVHEVIFKWRPPSGYRIKHLHCNKQSFAVWPQEKTFEVILQCEQAYLLCCSLQLMLKTINQQSNQHCSKLVCSGRSSELVH